MSRKNRRGWIYLTDAEMDEFLGTMAKVWSPKVWDVLDQKRTQIPKSKKGKQRE